jgi:cellulose synthase/poly-beta-1,6-N-acetylglucosamine synthase-like glycosyltransferase
MLTVSIPTYNTPNDLLRRAIRSALQLADMRLVVVNDGGRRPKLPSDSRIVYYEMDVNRGRYFCDGVVVAALQDGWWSPHDADDVSLPGRWDHASDLPRIAPYVRNGRVRPVNYPGEGWRHISHWCAGVYPVETVKGLTHPGFRVGWDTMFLLALERITPLAVDRQPSYQYIRRAGSLMTASETGKRSKYRAKQAAALRAMWETLDGDVRPQIVRSVDPELQAQVQFHAARLKAAL